MNKDHLVDAIRDALSTGTGMIQSTFRRKPLELPAPPINPCKELQFPGSAQDSNPFLMHNMRIDPGSLFDHKHLGKAIDQPTAQEILAREKQMEAFRAAAQKQEEDRQKTSRFAAVRDPMLKHLKALLEELAPTQLLLQSDHYTALAQLIDQIEKAPDDGAQIRAYTRAMHQKFKETFTG